MDPPTGAGPSPQDRLRDRHIELQRRVAAACEAVGRDPREVRVLPATKGRDVGYLDALHDLGYSSFGESRIGEFVRKRKARPDLSWEFIGRFRVEDAGLLARDTSLIHSVVDPTQANALEHAGEQLDRSVGVLLQLNLADDARKQGLDEGAAVTMAESWTYPHLPLRGLMVMGPAEVDAATTVDLFRRGRRVFHRLREIAGGNVDTLSMGMSGDFEIALREGATVVRIGTYLAEPWSPQGPR
ncbi:MAG: YggS family pyridoxal phosphate-dependent enzyme [Thermoplasmata archaeon]|nr:YggS family pyridoxal phosphate-dependent enzyme [Thermoplasmata archaeon]